MTDKITLTEEQKAIVGFPLEPLRVSAGAGTGKTTTIVARLAAAIADGLEPEQALGVTFTNKAAEELADRLRVSLHAFAAEGREVEVTTYHGFAARILAEFGAIVGVERNVQIIGPGYVRQLLHESIGAEPYNHLDLTALAWRVDEAANLGRQLAGNLTEPEAVLTAAPDPVAEPWGARLELVRILEAYRAHKRRLGVVDYGDLIQLAHRLVTEHPEVAARIRGRYRIVVVDEYQDTDPGQRELLRALFTGGFPITAVGDGDQTIYEWRGASRKNFAAFGDHFPPRPGETAATLPLTLSRRSGPRVLGMANAVRELLHGEPPGDPLRPAGDVPDELAYAWFRTAWEEATWIADEVRRLHDDEDIPWSDIAILFRKNRQISLVRDALHAADVPLEVVSLGGLLGVPEVADVHAWLSLLGRPDDSVALARVLLGPRYRLGLGDLEPLMRWCRLRMRSGDDATLGYPMLEAIDRLDEVEGLSDESAGRLRDFQGLFRMLLSDAQGVTLVELVRRIIDGIAGWSEIEAMPEAAGLSARLNLYRFLDLVEDWSPLTGRPSLEAFLGYLDLLQEERAPEELDTARIGGQDAVSLLTVHRAKGLEWHAVIVPALSSDVFPSRSQGYDDPLSGARWAPYELRLDAATQSHLSPDEKERKAALRAEHRAQELRTAYVAVTRARRILILTGAAWYENTRPKEPSEILALASKRPDATRRRWSDDPGLAPEPRPAEAEPPDPHFADGWRQALRLAIDDPTWAREQAAHADTYDAAHAQLRLTLDEVPEPLEPSQPHDQRVTSVTGLVTLASCPQRFYWTEVDRLPRRQPPWLRRGTEVHRRIELHHRGIAAFDELVPDAPEHGELDSVIGVDPYEVFAASRFAAMQPMLVETPIDISIAGLRVRGRIDAVFAPQPGSWEIVDYKSGRPSDDPAAIVQLEAYAVAAADGAIAGGVPERLSVTFAYLGVDPLVERVTIADEPWLDGARSHLEELAAAGQAAEFPPAPSMACRHCDFASLCPAGARWLAADGAL